MKVVIDHRGIVTYPGTGRTTLEAPPATGMSPNVLNVQTPTSASLYTLTDPGMYYLPGLLGATASMPNPVTVPGSMWIVSLTSGSQTLQLSGTTDLGDVARCFCSGTVGGASPQKVGNTLTLSPYGSVVLMSAGRSYLVLAGSGSITIA